LKTIEQVVQDLSSLLKLGQTAGRLAVMGSTYKRKSILLSGKALKTKSYEQMAIYYQKAYRVPNNPYAANSLANWLEAEYLLILLGKRKWGDVVKISRKEFYQLPSSLQNALTEVNKLKSSLLIMTPDKMDYRDMVAIATLELCQHILNPRTNPINSVLDSYKKIWNKSGSQGKKVAEIEHFDFLIDASNPIPKAQKVKKSIEYLKKQLQTIVEN
jgi:hypothetical protein